jgi:hypothetical protein
LIRRSQGLSTGGLRSVAVSRASLDKASRSFRVTMLIPAARLQHPRWVAGGNAPRDVGGIVDEDDWSQPLIVVLWDAADETRCVVAS